MRTDNGPDAPKEIFRKDYTPPEYLTKTVDLTFALDPEATVVTNTSHMVRNHKGSNPLVFNAENMTVQSVKINGQDVDFTHEDDLLTVENVPEEFDITTQVVIDPKGNTTLEGLYVSDDIYCTQCEAHGFRRITPSIDRPDNLSTYTVRVESAEDSHPVQLSNGNKIDSGEMEDGKHYSVWHDPFPKPSYLFALVSGDLAHIHDTFTTASDREVDLYVYVDKGNEGKCDHAMESLKKSMKWDEEVYGREYDLDLFNIVAVNAFNFGAMENKSLNVFNSKYVLATPDAAEDHNYLGIEGVVAHEYFHNWTGNRITCRDWFQLSLKEGLTVFRDQEFSGDMNSHDVKRIEDVQILRSAQFPEDAGPLSHPVRPDSYIDINNFYTATVYEKGAEVLRMMHTIMGPEKYRAGTDLYFDRHDGQAVTCDDFVQCMEDASGVDLTQFRLWYSQNGTPTVDVTTQYDPDLQTFTMKFTQETTGEPQHIPVRVGLIGPDGNDIEEHLVELKQAEQEIRFRGIAEMPVPSILRGFSAPVKLTTDLTNDNLRFLMVNDSDGFNRWDAGQTYATRMILGLVEDVQNGVPLAIDPDFVGAMHSLVTDRDMDKSLQAEALTLPGKKYLAELMDQVDVDALTTAIDFVHKTLSIELREELVELYHDNEDSGPYEPTPEAMGQRKLKNLALSYLTEAPDQAVITMAKEQFNAAANMTDSMAALNALIDTTSPEREEALEAYYDRWKDDPLPLDKWFYAQAVADRDTTVEDVQALMEHEKFTYENPNRLRSLVGAFAGANMKHFHRADGAGYKLLADVVIKMNDVNAQVAAGLLKTLQTWNRYDEARQELMKTELRRVLAVDSLKPEVYEIASKSLEADNDANSPKASTPGL